MFVAHVILDSIVSHVLPFCVSYTRWLDGDFQSFSGTGCSHNTLFPASRGLFSLYSACESNRSVLSMRRGFLASEPWREKWRDTLNSEGSSYGQQTIQGACILRPPSTTADGGLIKDRFDPWQRSLFSRTLNTRKRGLCSQRKHFYTSGG